MPGIIGRAARGTRGHRSLLSTLASGATCGVSDPKLLKSNEPKIRGRKYQHAVMSNTEGLCVLSTGSS